MKDWEDYWRTISQREFSTNILWDCLPEHAASEDLLRFKNHMDPNIPLLDLGCGNGRQTRFLARHFNRVIGVDISPSAIQLAKKDTADSSNIDYKVFDALNIEEVRKFHMEFGDVNVYMRGLFHMIKMSHRAKFICSIETLLGQKGVLYQIELDPDAFFYMRSLPQDILSSIPRIGWPVGFDLNERAFYYPEDRWTVIDEGQNVTIRILPLPDGKYGEVPANFLILKRNNLSS